MLKTYVHRLSCRCLECHRYFTRLPHDAHDTCPCGGRFAVDAAFHPDDPGAVDFASRPPSKTGGSNGSNGRNGRNGRNGHGITSTIRCESCMDVGFFVVAAAGGAVRKKIACPDCTPKAEAAP